MPLPHLASDLPFFMHAPSVYTFILMLSRLSPLVRCRLAGVRDIFSGFVNIRKHSARLSLQVMDGSNIVSVSFLRVATFFAFLLGVRDRSSWMSGARGLYLGARSWILVRASWAQSFGLWHPSSLSWMQS